jgi:hypothetical protein
MSLTKMILAGSCKYIENGSGAESIIASNLRLCPSQTSVHFADWSLEKHSQRIGTFVLVRKSHLLVYYAQSCLQIFTDDLF